MRAFTLDGFDAQPSLRDLPEPEITAEELLVRVHASSVNPVDAFIAAGYLQQYAEYEFPVTIGRDFAGVVERVGSDVTATRSATRSSATCATRARTCSAGVGRS